MTTTATRLRFRDPKPARFDECGICGQLEQHGPLTTKHDRAVHEVWALETYGMHAVAFPVRHLVERWASGELALPNEEEYQQLVDRAIERGWI